MKIMKIWGNVHLAAIRQNKILVFGLLMLYRVIKCIGLQFSSKNNKEISYRDRANATIMTNTCKVLTMLVVLEVIQVP